MSAYKDKKTGKWFIIVISKVKTKEKQNGDFKPNEKHWNGKGNSSKNKK